MEEQTEEKGKTTERRRKSQEGILLGRSPGPIPGLKTLVCAHTHFIGESKKPQFNDNVVDIWNKG